MFKNPDQRYGTSDAFRFSMREGVSYLESLALSGCDFITHAFCTRWGGTSEGKLADLNFGSRSGDTEEHLSQNREILCSAFDIPTQDLVTVNQVHEDRILIIDEKIPDWRNSEDLEYDGIISAIPGVAIGVITADCVPVLLVDCAKRVVGVVHAGWRGTTLGVVARAIDAFMKEFASRPSDILAAIGPAIGPCCYEVDESVLHHFDNKRSRESFFTRGKKEGKWMLDLPLANRYQLHDAGVPPENIFAADICTSCNTDTFFSHRGEGDAGRQLSFIMLR